MNTYYTINGLVFAEKDKFFAELLAWENTCKFHSFRTKKELATIECLSKLDYNHLDPNTSIEYLFTINTNEPIIFNEFVKCSKDGLDWLSGSEPFILSKISDMLEEDGFLPDELHDEQERYSIEQDSFEDFLRCTM
jgi:hypothetical protein